MAHLLLAGYFGCGNLGDDAVLLGFLEGLRKERYDVTVLSGAPDETYRMYGVPAVPRKDMAMVGEAIGRCDGLVFPGGSIFQDVTSVRSVAYYAQLVRKAKSAGKKVVMLGQGVGPLTSFFGKRMASGAFNAADALAVRDPASLETLRALGVKTSARVTADFAFLLPKPEEGGGAAGYQVGNMKTVGLAPRPHGKGAAVATLFGDLARLLYASNMMPVLIEMDRDTDAPLIQEISKRQGGKIPDIRKMATPMQLQQRMARMDAIIAMRLHAGILAATVGVPPLMVSYDPKVTALAKLLDIGAARSMQGLTAQRLFESFIDMQRERERNLQVLARKQEELSKLARENIELLRVAIRPAATL
jgi:polysaccharide pyruvyl transferase CsaB